MVSDPKYWAMAVAVIPKSPNMCYFLETLPQPIPNFGSETMNGQKIASRLREGSFKKKPHIWAAVPSSGPPPPPPYLGHP